MRNEELAMRTVFTQHRERWAAEGSGCQSVAPLGEDRSLSRVLGCLLAMVSRATGRGKGHFYYEEG